jgi:hypothetical protein
MDNIAELVFHPTKIHPAKNDDILDSAPRGNITVKPQPHQEQNLASDSRSSTSRTEVTGPPKPTARALGPNRDDFFASQDLATDNEPPGPANFRETLKIASMMKHQVRVAFVYLFGGKNDFYT